MELPAYILEIGKRVIVGVHDGNGERQYISRVADVLGQSFALTTPTQQQVLVHFEPGDSVVVYVSDTSAMYELRSRVRGKQFDPVALIILSEPTEVKRVQRRQHFRIDVLIGPVQLAITPPDQPNNKNTISGTIVNISAGGMRFTSKEQVVPHSQISAVAELPLGFGKVVFTGMILRVDRRANGVQNLHEASVQFVDLPEKERDRITQYIFRYQAELRKKGLA